MPTDRHSYDNSASADNYNRPTDRDRRSRDDRFRSGRSDYDNSRYSEDYSGGSNERDRDNPFDKRNYERSSYDRQNRREEFDGDARRDRMSQWQGGNGGGDRRSFSASEEARRQGWQQESDDSNKSWYSGDRHRRESNESEYSRPRGDYYYESNNSDDRMGGRGTRGQDRSGNRWYGRPGDHGWREGRGDGDVEANRHAYYEQPNSSLTQRAEGYAAMTSTGRPQGMYGRTMSAREDDRRSEAFQNNDTFGGQGYANAGYNNSRNSGQDSSALNYGNEQYGSRGFAGSSYSRNESSHMQSGPFSGRGPKSFRRSDDRIREDVCEVLMHHGEIDASEVEVEVKDGEVTLTGSVENRDQKRMAEDAAERVSGVRDVRNNISVATQPANTEPNSDTPLSKNSSIDGAGLGASSNGSARKRPS